MDRQEVYNTIRDHLLRQHAKALMAGGACAYQAFNGRKCAIGCLIKDEHYDPMLECRSLFDVEVVSAVEKSIGKLTSDDLHFLRRFQLIHDKHAEPLWGARLRDVATDYQLTP